MKPYLTHLIIGCGYLGKRLLTILDDQPCWFTNRSQISDAHSLLLDINNESTWHSLDAMSEEQGLVIYFMLPPSQIDLTVFPDFINRLNQLNIRRCILISSTVVYGNSDRVVDADSDVEIDSERAKRQYQIEQAWLATLNNASVIRLAGIYGPDRIVGRNMIMKGETIDGDPDGWLNLIHVDDAASLVKRIGEIDKPEEIELGCDGMPIRRRDYYSFLAEQLLRCTPEFNQHDQSRGTGRRCDNKLTITRTGWSPEYADFRKALVELL